MALGLECLPGQEELFLQTEEKGQKGSKRLICLKLNINIPTWSFFIQVKTLGCFLCRWIKIFFKSQFQKKTSIRLLRETN